MACPTEKCMLRVLSVASAFAHDLVKGCIVFMLFIGTQVHGDATHHAHEMLESGSKAPQEVLVSVHPMALLVKSAWPKLMVSSLVSANQSPHDFVLKPSDMTRIANADAVIWMGKGFEPYLEKVVRKAVVVDVSESVHLDEEVSIHNHEVHAHSKGHRDFNQHVHSQHAHDPHLWLDPNNIVNMVMMIQRHLGLPEPTEFLNQYASWKTLAILELTPHQKTGFVSFHDAFHEWVKAFQLNQLAVVTNNPEKPVGTRHMIEVRNILASGDAQCLFVEPQFQSRIVPKLHKGLDIKVIKIDPMASAYSIGDAKFIGFYEELLRNFTQCFSKPTN